MKPAGEQPIILAAGGTGGHVLPALAVYQELKRRGLKPVLFSDQRGLRFAKGFDQRDIHVVPSGGLVSGSPLKRLRGLAELFAGWRVSRKLIKQLKPCGVLGLGGYASVPPIIAADQLGLPTLLHQGDKVLGRANGFVAGRVNKLLLSFPQTRGVSAKLENRTVVTGSPLREAIEALAARPATAQPTDQQLRILCVGGSLGARALGKILPKAIGMLTDQQRAKISVVQQVSEDQQRQDIAQSYQSMSVQAQVTGFIEDMAAKYADCDLVVGRSGSTTVLEVAAAGKPAVFVPLGLHADAQQTHNASYLRDAGAAWIVQQNDTAASGLAAIMRDLFENPNKLAEMALIARQQAILRATASIADIVEQEFRPL